MTAIRSYSSDESSYPTAGDEYQIDVSGDQVTINGQGTSADVTIEPVLDDGGQIIEGVFYAKDSSGNLQIFITKDAGNVDVNQEMIDRLFDGEEYDSNNITVILDQDNFVEGEQVGKVSITTDVGNIVVDNDNDFSKVTAGNTNVALVDLFVSGQDDDLVITQSIDVTTMGWSNTGDGVTQNIGSNVNYDIDGVNNVQINGTVNNTFTTTDEGAVGLQAGNQVSINTTNVTRITDTTHMINDFQVGDEIDANGVPTIVLDWLEERGISIDDVTYVNAADEGITNVNHFKHGKNGGEGVILMQMENGSWVVSGSGVPQTYTFWAEGLDENGNPVVSDPFNRVTYNATMSAGAETNININELTQTANGRVYGVENYRIENSVSTQGGIGPITGNPTQEIHVDGINYSLSTDSGNLINGQQNTQGIHDETHTQQIYVQDPIGTSYFNICFFNDLWNNFIDWSGTSEEFIDDLKNFINNSEQFSTWQLTGDDVISILSDLCGKDATELSFFDLQTAFSCDTVVHAITYCNSVLSNDVNANYGDIISLCFYLEDTDMLNDVISSLSVDSQRTILEAARLQFEDLANQANQIDGQSENSEAMRETIFNTMELLASIIEAIGSENITQMDDVINSLPQSVQDTINASAEGVNEGSVQDYQMSMAVTYYVIGGSNGNTGEDLSTSLGLSENLGISLDDVANYISNETMDYLCGKDHELGLRDLAELGIAGLISYGTGLAGTVYDRLITNLTGLPTIREMVDMALDFFFGEDDAPIDTTETDGPSNNNGGGDNCDIDYPENCDTVYDPNGPCDLVA